MACLDGFFGHFDMLYDDERNDKYAAAIQKAASSLLEQKQGCPLTAIDIGSGSGLLGLLCWQTKAFHSVVLLEANPPLAEAARENIKKNHADESCVVWEGHSTDVLLGPVASDLRRLSPPFDLCVSELLDSVLIGEGVLATLREALSTPWLKPSAGTIMIPSKAVVWGRVFNSEALYSRHRFAADSVCGGLTIPEVFRRCPGLHAAEHIHLGPFLEAGLMRFTSDQFEIFDFDFSTVDKLPKNGCRKLLEVQVEPGQVAHGVALWFDTQLYGDVVLSMAPQVSAPREHWRQAVLCFRRPRMIEAKTASHGVLCLEAHHDDDAIWLTPARERFEHQPVGSRTSRITSNTDENMSGHMPAGLLSVCRCGLHAGTARSRLGWQKDMLQQISSITIPRPAPQQAVTRGALFFGDGGLLPVQLAQVGYKPVVCIGRGLLNERIVQSFAVANGFGDVIRQAHASGQLLPLTTGKRRMVRSSESKPATGKADSDASASSDEDFDWQVLAETLHEELPRESSWEVFTEPWYDNLAEDWSLASWQCFASDFRCLHRHSTLRALSSEMNQSSTFQLMAAAFECKRLWRSFQRLPDDLNQEASLRGLDLRALNNLHPGQPSTGFCVDAWPLRADGCLKIVSSAVEVLPLDPLHKDDLEEVFTSRVELADLSTCHGVLLWVKRKVSRAEDTDWFEALTTSDKVTMSSLRHTRFGVVLVAEPGTVRKVLSVAVLLRPHLDFQISVSTSE